jgi:hypothetical protein
METDILGLHIKIWANISLTVIVNKIDEHRNSTTINCSSYLIHEIGPNTTEFEIFNIEK